MTSSLQKRTVSIPMSVAVLALSTLVACADTSSDDSAAAATSEALKVNRDPRAYVITTGLQFGVVDLTNGAFQPIGPAQRPDIGSGLVPGPGSSLLTLDYSGNLSAIDPKTGASRVIGPTGLHQCYLPTDACGPNAANAFGANNGALYALDAGQNLYSVNKHTGAASLIGQTGIPPITFLPEVPTEDGKLSVYSESLFSFRGDLYVNFGTQIIDLNTFEFTTTFNDTLYKLDAKSGTATRIAQLEEGLTSIVNVNDTVYAFSAATFQEVTINMANGETHAVTALDPALAVVQGATAVNAASTH
jgi:hypothetical protein